jgi:hypothetical protein
MARMEQDEKKLLLDAKQANDANLVQIIKANAERYSKNIDLQLKAIDTRHRHRKENIELSHNIQMDHKKENNNAKGSTKSTVE